MNKQKLQCMTTAQWLRGYAETLDKERYDYLIHRMNLAADLLGQVWDGYAAANGYETMEQMEARNDLHK